MYQDFRKSTSNSDKRVNRSTIIKGVKRLHLQRRMQVTIKHLKLVSITEKPHN